MGHFRRAELRPFLIHASLGLTLGISLLASSRAQAQCQASSIPVEPATTPQSPQFFDQPHFTVAGVTDAANPGGHGTEVLARTKESLAKDTASLGKTSPIVPTGSEPPLKARAPDDFDGIYRLGKHLAEGKPREALPYLERASQLAPADQPAAQKAALHHLIAETEEQVGNPLEAVRQYEAAARLDASETNLFDWGAELLLHRSLQPAIDVFAEGHNQFPNSVRMLLGLGVALYDRGSFDESVRCLCRASDLKPDDPTPYTFLGKIESVQAAPLAGVSERLERFVRLHPDSALANYYYGLSLWKQQTGTRDAALAAKVQSLLENAIRLDPKLGVAHLQLGIVYVEQQNFPAAIAALQQAIQVSPQVEEAHYRLSQAYQRAGDSRNAKRELEVYQEVKKRSVEQAAKDRGEIKEFVITYRDETPAKSH